MSISIVVTTINPPTAGMEALARGLGGKVERLLVIGDAKTPSEWSVRGAQYLSVDVQKDLPFALAPVLPLNTYTRKMIGYLVAASHGTTWIRETDDDNTPYQSFFDDTPLSVIARYPSSSSKWLNIYSHFTSRFIWPRGLPLRFVRSLVDEGDRSSATVEVSGPMVVQALADGDPDVDAVYRLTAPDATDVTFAHELPLISPPGKWTPFNSQATTWPRELLPMMYLPSTCSFRMTDIWRSYIAQRLMPGLGATLVVTAPTVYQERNEHDLMRDFHDEIEGYLGYERFVNVLEETPITGGFGAFLSDLRRLYLALIAAGFFTSTELPILDAWLCDMASLGFDPTT